MDKYSLPLEGGKFYHIYNQGNNRENIFYSSDNYEYFLHKFDEYLSDFVDVYAYCLMPNHFHFLIRVKELGELETSSSHFLQNRPNRPARFSKPCRSGKPSAELSSEPLCELPSISEIVSNQFRLFFMSYSKSINKQIGRTGSLFRKNFKRKEITDLLYLQQAVVYIHRNPLHHGFLVDFQNYPWNTYSRMMEEKLTKLKKQEVLDWFGDKANYQFVHTIDVENEIE